VQRIPIEEWPYCKYHEYKKRKPTKAQITAGRQPRTKAAASTIVRASTASTSELKNAVGTAGAAVVQFTRQVPYNRMWLSKARRGASPLVLR
jgi:hypothetical protein